MLNSGMRALHPDVVLQVDYLKPLGLSVNALAKALDVPTSRMNDIVHERRGVSADTALRLYRYFGSHTQGWLNLQTAYDLERA
jgi:addiction module HigA family antidote